MSDLVDVSVLDGLKDFIGAEKLALVINVYMESTPEYVAGIVAAHEKGDAQGIVDLAHSLKSSSANLGLLKVSEISNDLERQGHDVIKGESKLSIMGDGVALLQDMYRDSLEILKAQIA